MSNNNIKNKSNDLTPGTIIQIGNETCQIQRFLASGGYAQVYLTTNSKTGHSCVLKRCVYPLNASSSIQAEISCFKSIGKHPKLVEMFATKTSSLLQQQLNETLMLLEYCEGGNLLDLMNSRLTNRLSEAEITKIFTDVCEAVAYLHNLKPAIVHRDIKVENVLISSSGDHKLCDFGSSTSNIILPGVMMSANEIKTMESELDKMTTLAYRAPEQCDLYQRKGLTEKVDVWALGVLLYKLCYYTTPFENAGKMAILHARYTVPSFPAFSRSILETIDEIFKIDPIQRPSALFLANKMKIKLGNPQLPYPNSNQLPTISSTTNTIPAINSQKYEPTQANILPIPQKTTVTIPTASTAIPNISYLPSNKTQPFHIQMHSQHVYQPNPSVQAATMQLKSMTITPDQSAVTSPNTIISTRPTMNNYISSSSSLSQMPIVQSKTITTTTTLVQTSTIKIAKPSAESIVAHASDQAINKFSSSQENMTTNNRGSKSILHQSSLKNHLGINRDFNSRIAPDNQIHVPSSSLGSRGINALSTHSGSANVLNASAKSDMSLNVNNNKTLLSYSNSNTSGFLSLSKTDPFSTIAPSASFAQLYPTSFSSLTKQSSYPSNSVTDNTTNNYNHTRNTGLSKPDGSRNEMNNGTNSYVNYQLYDLNCNQNIHKPKVPLEVDKHDPFIIQGQSSQNHIIINNTFNGVNGNTKNSTNPSHPLISKKTKQIIVGPHESNLNHGDSSKANFISKHDPFI